MSEHYEVHESPLHGPHDGHHGATPQVAEFDALLATLDDRPVEDHVTVYEQTHRRLREQLDSASTPPTSD